MIVLPASYNTTHEHAILGAQDQYGDRRPKGLRISINTKNIRLEDLLYVERENRSAMTHGPAETGFIPVNSELFVKDSGAGMRVVAPEAKWPTEPTVWCCRAGKRYPPDAVYVGCLTARFKGTVYGNDYEPFKGHRDWIAQTDKEFRKYAKKKMQGPAFRAQAIIELRGKHLLCWCSQDKSPDGSYKQPFCHARVWLEIVNRPEYGQ